MFNLLLSCFVVLYLLVDVLVSVNEILNCELQFSMVLFNGIQGDFTFVIREKKTVNCDHSIKKYVDQLFSTAWFFGIFNIE